MRESPRPTQLTNVCSGHSPANVLRRWRPSRANTSSGRWTRCAATRRWRPGSSGSAVGRFIASSSVTGCTRVQPLATRPARRAAPSRRHECRARVHVHRLARAVRARSGNHPDFQGRPMAGVMSHDRSGAGSRAFGPARRAPGVSPRVQDAFTNALLRDRLIARTALQSAVRHAEEAGLRVHEAVVTLCFVAERVSYQLLAAAADLRYVEGRAIAPSPLALRLVPARVARQHELLPLAVSDRTITYLTATPDDFDADRDVSFTTGR